MTTKTSPYWSVEVSCQNADEESYLAFELGAEGVQILNQNLFICSIQATQEELNNFLQGMRTYCFTCESPKKIEERNWVQECADVWAPIQVESWKIIPVMSASDIPSTLTAHDIAIIPGEGFGTGHHPSTRFILKLIATLKEQNFRCERALDLGTGSGVLAIAIAKAFNIPVCGVDTDPIALKNAAENIEINALSSVISLMQGTSQILSERFDLIAANIYAEVLIALEPEFIRLLKPGGKLLLAGIMQSKEQLVRDAFQDPAWQINTTLHENDWSGLLLTRSTPPAQS